MSTIRSLALVASAALPPVMRRFGLALPALALVALISVPLTAHAGEWLEQHVDSDPLVRKHAELGDRLLPWTIALFLLATAVWWAYRRAAGTGTGTTRPAKNPVAASVRIAATVLCLVVGAGAVIQVYRIGDSGAKAVWHDGYSATAHTERD